MTSLTFKRFFRKNDISVTGSYFCKALLCLLLLTLVFPAATFGLPPFEIFSKSEEELDLKKFTLGRIEFHPGFSFVSKYDDNVFLLADKILPGGSEGKQGDFVFINKPSLGAELKRTPGEVFGFDFSYLGEDEHFVDLGDTQDAFNHNVSGNLNFGGTGGQSDITLGGTYEKTRNARTFDIQTNVGSRASFEDYTGLLDFVYLPSNTLKLMLGGNFLLQRFDAPNQTFDSNLYNLTGAIFWQSSPLLAYGIAYIHSIRDYKTPTASGPFDSDTDQVSLAANWLATPWLEGELSVGMNSKKYDDFSKQNVVFQFDLKYRPVNRTQITLRLNREIRDTLFSTTRFLIYNGARLNLARKLGKKFLGEIKGQYGHYDYRRPTQDFQGSVTPVFKTRVDNRMEASLALTYQIQDWLAAIARYRYVENSSNFDGSDFINNVGTIEISAAY